MRVCPLCSGMVSSLIPSSLFPPSSWWSYHPASSGSLEGWYFLEGGRVTRTITRPLLSFSWGPELVPVGIGTGNSRICISLSNQGGPRISSQCKISINWKHIHRNVLFTPIESYPSISISSAESYKNYGPSSSIPLFTFKHWTFSCHDNGGGGGHFISILWKEAQREVRQH